jgi:hypothetical protein
MRRYARMLILLLRGSRELPGSLGGMRLRRDDGIRQPAV